MPLAPCFRSLVPLVSIGYVLTLPLPVFAESAGPAAAPDAPAEAEPPADEPDKPAVSPLLAHQQEVLHKSLQDAQHDREQTTTLLPWVTVATGAVLLLAGVLVGAQAAIGCHDACKGASATPAWLVIGGTTVGTLGVIWLERTNRDIAAIETRQYRINNELERIEWNRAPVPHAALGPSLSLRASF